MSDSDAPSHVFRRSLGRAMPVVAHGSGAVLWDREGRRYIDGSSGAVVVNIGHGRAEVAAAIAAQANAVAYVHATHFTSDVIEHYAARLAAYVPGGCHRLYLVSGGSEANETAVKLARCRADRRCKRRTVRCFTLRRRPTRPFAITVRFKRPTRPAMSSAA